MKKPMQTIQTVQKMPHTEVSSGPVGSKQWYIKPLKHQTKIAADEFLIFYFYLLKKIRLDFSCEFT